MILDDDPAARVTCQGDTRLRYLDELPAMRARLAEHTRHLASGAEHG